MDKFTQLRTMTREALEKETGCEWLKSKSMQDIGAYTLEETYELLDALDHKNPEAVKEELADLAFHLVLYAEMAAKKGDFTLEDVLQSALKKQQQRRLSLTKKAASAKEAHDYWLTQKRKTRPKHPEGVLSDIPDNMPALIRSKKIQDRVAEVGFDWDDIKQIFNKLNEEIDEFKAEYEINNQPAMLDELGDILFTLVNIGRHLNVDAEQALRYANNKFIRRFKHVEMILADQGQAFESMNFKALLEVWQQVKESENHM